MMRLTMRTQSNHHQDKSQLQVPILIMSITSFVLFSSEDPNGEEAGSDDEDDDTVRRPQYDFSRLSPRIQEVISEYGAVFPKLNWSSPQVRWSLHCTTVHKLSNTTNSGRSLHVCWTTAQMCQSKRGIPFAKVIGFHHARPRLSL